MHEHRTERRNRRVRWGGNAALAKVGCVLGSPSLSSTAVVSFPRDRKGIASSRRANRVIVNTAELSQDVIASAGCVVVSIRPRHVSLGAAGARVTLMNETKSVV